MSKPRGVDIGSCELAKYGVVFIDLVFVDFCENDKALESFLLQVTFIHSFSLIFVWISLEF